MKNFGFTLAEVLITLAIIGVVAAITIPTLITANQQRGWNTAATVFERKLEESLKIMNSQGTLAGYRNTKDFVTELSKHLKIIKICNNNDLMSCFEDTVLWGGGDATPEEVDMTKIKTAKHFGQNDWGTDLLGIQLANGTSGLIAYNPDCKQDPYSNQITGTSCLALLYDTSGFAKPNTSGKDLRGINITKLGRSCAFELGGSCFGTPFIPTSLTKAECEAQKDDLGIENCYYDNDYWAGAVAACGGISKMPTKKDLTAIAEDIYGTKINDSDTWIYENWNETKASSFGFNTTTGSFCIWAAEQYVSNRVFSPYFDSSRLYWSNAGYRNSDTYYAVCLAD